jgi:transposase
VLAKCACPDSKSRKRFDAIHLLLIGVNYDQVLLFSGVKERTLRLWTSRYNDLGIDGLIYRPHAGRPRKMEAPQVRTEIIPLLEDPSLAQQTHWTLTKLHGYLKEQQQLDLSYRTLHRYIKEQDYVRRIPRPMPEPPDKVAWQQRREQCAQDLFAALNDPNKILYFSDEAGFEGDPRPRQKWVKRGSNPTQPYYGAHVRKNIVAAVHPESGEFVSLIVPHNDKEVFQAFLDTFAQEVPQREGKEILLVLDNASWHKAKSLNWHHITPFYLSSYSPDFNPIERLWQHIKSHYLAGYITNRGAELEQKLYDTLRSLLQDPDTVKSVCANRSYNGT